MRLLKSQPVNLARHKTFSIDQRHGNVRASYRDISITHVVRVGVGVDERAGAAGLGVGSRRNMGFCSHGLYHYHYATLILPTHFIGLLSCQLNKLE